MSRAEFAGVLRSEKNGNFSLSGNGFYEKMTFPDRGFSIPYRWYCTFTDDEIFWDVGRDFLLRYY